MGNKQFTQTGYANMFPVSVKEGKLCNKKPDFKKLAEHRTLILLIGLSDNKKIRKFAEKDNVRRITYSVIRDELQETVTDMNDFQQKVNNEFYTRVKKALKLGTALVERYFYSLDARLGFLEVAMEKDLAYQTILIVSKQELKKNDELAKQLSNKTLLKGVDKVYLM